MTARLPSSARDLLTAIGREMDARGIAWRIDHGRKHPRIVWQQDGRDRWYVIPGSPSDHRSIQACLTDLRRLLGGRVVVKSARRKGYRPKTREPLPSLPRITILPDPFADLGRRLAISAYAETWDRIEERTLLAEWRVSLSRLSFAEFKRQRAKQRAAA